MPISVIDLFAGPGGLAEGFSSLIDKAGEREFEIKLSIEKDEFAHQTLTLRSFLRQFPYKRLPSEYYQFIKGDITLADLFRRYPDQFKEASNEAWKATLGDTPVAEVDKKIQKALNGEENWLLIGGPPCQAYSNVGRSRVGGVFEEDHRVFLYKEYLRIIARHHPAVFVMENVEGLLSAKLNGEKIFNWILRDLSDPSSVFDENTSPKYKIHSLVKADVNKDSDYLIKAEDYGVPQRRHRVILVGVRDDIARKPSILVKTDKVDLHSIIGNLPKIRSGISKSYSHTEEIIKSDGTIKKKRFYSKVDKSYQNWMRVTGNLREELSNKLDIKKDLESSVSLESMGSEFLPCSVPPIDKNQSLKEWYFDAGLPGITHHVSRTHLLQDLKRYLFATLYTKKYKKFPKLNDYDLFDSDLLPNHKNVHSGKFTDRFRVQLPDIPATTITSHISKDGHYFIHYDPLQCRSLTVREAARIQTFPDNYFFCGSRTDQFHQVGNAVPPFLAFQIAKVVNDIFKADQPEKVIMLESLEDRYI